MNKLFTIGFFICSLFITPATYGSLNDNYYFRNFEVEDGLSQNMVYSILQDQQGFMWFGTQDGLNRYDGESFKIYKKSAADPRSIGSNAIFSLMQDKQGIIWVGTLNGVSLYHPEYDRFTHLDLKTADGQTIDGIIRDIKEDNEGNVWLVDSNKGIFRLSSKNQIKLYSIRDKRTGSQVSVRKIAFDINGNLWIATNQSGLYQLDTHTGEVSQFLLEDGLEEFPIYDLYLLNAETLLVGTQNRGVQSFNLITHRFSPLLEYGPDGKSLFVRHIFRDDDENLWFGTESGVYIYNLQTQKSIHLKHVYNDPYSISDNAIYSIYQDRDGGMWIGTYFGGVNYFTESYAQFEKYYPLKGVNSISGKCISEFCQDDEQNIWIGTEDAGLNRFNPRDRKFAQGFVPASNIHALLFEKDRLWVGTYSSGLYILNTKTLKVVSHKISTQDSTLKSNDIYSIYRDYSGTMWIGTTSGLNIYDENPGIFKPIKEHVINSQVNDILEDNNNVLWFATLGDGLFSYDKLRNKWTNYKSPIEKDNRKGEMITCLLEDHNHQVWIGTEGAGLCMYDRAHDSFTNIYSTENGLPNDVVYKLIEDDAGNIWGSTNKGIFKLNPHSRKIHSFTYNDGLPGNQFNYKSGFKSNSGKIFFGLTKGFISFQPEQIQSSLPPAPIVISSFQVFNKEVVPGARDSLLKKSIIFTKELNLPYNQAFFSLGFSILNYASSKKYLYAYRLEGRDKNWIYTDKLGRLTYSNLSPGDYVFQIKISNGNESGASKVHSLKINVLPPFYRSNLAYGIYAFIMIFLVFLFLRIYTRRLEQRNKIILLNLEDQKEKELYQSKIEFFTNITHEIRTPLSLIKTPLEEVMKGLNPKDPNWENLSITQRNTDRLLKLVNELLDFRKAESKGLSLNITHVDIISIIKDTISRFIPSARLKGILFQSHVSETEFFADVDPEIFTKILSNIINNALKHAESTIQLRFNHLEDKFVITVTNDGQTIPQEFAKKIFEPFYKVNSNLQGTGLGLPLSRLMVELHDGVIYLDTNSPQTSFVIEFPVKQKRVIHLRDNDRGMSYQESENSADLSLLDSLMGIDEKRTILSVEDNEEFQNFMAKQLMDSYYVLKSQNGEEALEILNSSKHIDIIICDIMMPGMDGLTFCEKVKSDLKFSHIPVILLTAKTTMQSKIDGLVIGADDYIVKPYSIDFLVARIENLLENRRKVRESYKHSPEINFDTIVNTNADKDFLNKLIEVIQSNFDDVNLDVDKLAAHMNMSRATFYRKVKSISELTPNEFIRLTRLKKAAELLRQKKYSITEIAFIVGFNSSSYFSKCFHKQFGILPKDFE